MTSERKQRWTALATQLGAQGRVQFGEPASDAAIESVRRLVCCDLSADLLALYHEFDGALFTYTETRPERADYDHQLLIFSTAHTAHMAELFYSYAKSEFEPGTRPDFNRFLPVARPVDFWGTCFIDLQGDTSVSMSDYEDEEHFLTTDMRKIAASLDEFVENSIACARQKGDFYRWIFEKYRT